MAKNTHFYMCLNATSKRGKSIWAICLFGISSIIFAAEEVLSQDILLDDLFQELEQVTAIATRTKLNVDYVPGMVTVLHGADLQKRGIHSLTEALETVPGVEITISSEGQTFYVMRGVGKTFSSGKVKMLINGRPMNAAMSASSTVATIPLQLIERIEVIRGPGSAIYGEYAFAGVVNIIVRKDSHLFYGGSGHEKHIIGGSWSNFESDDTFKYALSMSAYDNAGKQVVAGDDYLKDLNSGSPLDPYFNSISKSPGNSNEAEQMMTSSLQMAYKDYQWDTFFQHHVVGDYFGYQNALPPEVKPIRKIITLSSDIDNKFSISENIKGSVTAGGRYYALRGDLHHFLPVGFPDLTTLDTGTGSIGNYFDDGVLGSPNYTEYEAHGGLPALKIMTSCLV